MIGLALCATPGCGNPVERPVRPIRGARPHRLICEVCQAKKAYREAVYRAIKARREYRRRKAELTARQAKWKEDRRVKK